MKKILRNFSESTHFNKLGCLWQLFFPRHHEFGCSYRIKNKDNGISHSTNSCQSSGFKILANCVIIYGTNFFLHELI